MSVHWSLVNRDWFATRCWRGLVIPLLSVAAIFATESCTKHEEPGARTFKTPEEAVRALDTAIKAGRAEDVIAIFGPEGKEVVDTSDPSTSRRNREVFAAAMTEGWQLVDQGANAKTLVIGNEAWPFPIPLVMDANGWRFDSAAGKEEVIARRVGRNELAAIRVCRTYVSAQHLYAQRGHDGQPPGIYARTLRSENGRENGLYWATSRGQRRSPLGDLVAYAATEGTQLDRDRSQPTPFHGYYFRILTAQGAAAPGGMKDYVVQSKMSGGFALVAWPAQYDATGVMTFIVNQDGVVREKDLGPGTDEEAKKVMQYNPDASWELVQ
jgi:hypothetical protein